MKSVLFFVMLSQDGNIRSCPTTIDHLTNEAKRDAPRMGEHLRNKHLVPDAIISSTAERAHATPKAVADASGYKGEVTLNRSLYAAGPRAYLDVLHDLSDDFVRVLIFGHNPGLEESVEMLTAEIHVMPTCSLVHVKLHVDRRLDIDYETKGELVDIWLPGA